MTRDQVFTEAKKYFAEGGLGMKVGAEEGAQIHFFGDGLVWLTYWPATQGEKSFRVDIDVSERDADAHDFIEKVLRPHSN
jgi:hypothetical protein